MGIVFGISNCAHSTFFVIALMVHNNFPMIVYSNLNVHICNVIK